MQINPPGVEFLGTISNSDRERAFCCRFFASSIKAKLLGNFTSYRGTQREVLRKRPKNNNTAWIKLSEDVLSILGDCWDEFFCSSLPARQMEEFPANNVHLQPATWLTAGFPADVCPHNTGHVGCGHKAKFSSSVGNWVWYKGEISSRAKTPKNYKNVEACGKSSMSLPLVPRSHECDKKQTKNFVT